MLTKINSDPPIKLKHSPFVLYNFHSDFFKAINLCLKRHQTFIKKHAPLGKMPSNYIHCAITSGVDKLSRKHLISLP